MTKSWRGPCATNSESDRTAMPRLRRSRTAAQGLDIDGRLIVEAQSTASARNEAAADGGSAPEPRAPSLNLDRSAHFFLVRERELLELFHTWVGHFGGLGHAGVRDPRPARLARSARSTNLSRRNSSGLPARID